MGRAAAKGLQHRAAARHRVSIKLREIFKKFHFSDLRRPQVEDFATCDGRVESLDKIATPKTPNTQKQTIFTAQKKIEKFDMQRPRSCRAPTEVPNSIRRTGCREFSRLVGLIPTRYRADSEREQQATPPKNTDF